MKEKIRKLKKNEKGITFVALVVTIVVLLILAGITIVYVFGENGVFKLAQEAKEKTDQAKNDEQDYFNNIGNTINEYLDGNGGTTNSPEQPNTPTIEKLEDLVGKPADTTKNIKAKDQYGNQIIIPAGFFVVEDTTSNNVTYSYSGDGKPTVQDGIVIQDSNNGNQFVWVPVGNNIKGKNNTTTSITLGRYTFDENNGTPTLKQEAINYKETVYITSAYAFTETVEEYTGDAGSVKPARNLAKFVSQTNENRGFYIARYEASDNFSKITYNQPVHTVTQISASKISQDMYIDMFFGEFLESDLTNSYAWDTAMVFIQKFSPGNSDYSVKSVVTITEPLNSGVSGDVACNIYDLSNNYEEHTTEHTSDPRFSWCTRGGSPEHKWGAGKRAGYTNYAQYSAFRPIIYCVPVK